MKNENSIVTKVVSIIAIAFGLLTLKSGGSVLFIDGIAREQAGNYVPFVLWFNFLMGFIYIATGVFIWLQKKWAIKLSYFVFFSTLVIFLLLGVHINTGGDYEQRTIFAMILRSSVWLFITLFLYWKIIKSKKTNKS